MFRHLFIAALRNIAANRLQSAIAIIGLSIGITAALLMVLVVRNQMNFDHFIPGYERTYLAVSQFTQRGQAQKFGDRTPSTVAALLKLNVPEVENTTRLMLPPWNISGESMVTLKQGAVAAEEAIYWADPNVFDVLPLPVFQGDLSEALHRPDGIVLPREMALKYFGRDDVVGRTILVNDHPMVVRAVIEDLPANRTSLKSGIFASGIASFSPLAADLSHDSNPVITIVRLKHGASIANVERQLPSLINKSKTSIELDLVQWKLMKLDQLPLFEGLHPGAKAKLAVTGIVGALILFIAAINFVNLLTARATRRSIEVGIRKVCGAAQRALMAQFLGEAVLTVFFATCIAVTSSEWLLPTVNAFLTTGGTFDYGQNPYILGSLLAAVVVLGLLAGAYPAFVLSSFRPAGVLKGVLPHSTSADLIRNALVVLQFAILVGLLVAATVIYQQNLYATRDGLRGNIDQMLVMRGGCKPAFRTELRKLTGVEGVACTDLTFLQGQDLGSVTYKGKIFYYMGYVSLDPGAFALYGMKPLAGSLPSASSVRDNDSTASPQIVLNAAAIKRLGFASPQAAIGQILQSRPFGQQGARILAVVPDFSFQPLGDQPIWPTIYSNAPNPFGDDDDLVGIKLKGQQIPETLADIDQTWSAVNPGIPIDRFFLNDHMQQLYLSILREAQLFAAFSGVAVFLACLGLLGLSISNADRRTKEVGIRKAMGATSTEIVALMLWQFSRPVLVANLLAWPTAFWVMNRWLSGFAYHVELHWWVFAAASVVALLIALVTVTGQALLVARQKPVLALRYE